MDCYATQNEDQNVGNENDEATVLDLPHLTCDRCLCLDDFGVGRKIGRGKFGHVFLCQHKQTLIKFAMKVLFLSELKKNDAIGQTKNEIENQFSLKHKHILSLRAYFYDEKRIFIIQDYCPNGNLCQRLKEEIKFSEPTTVKYVTQLVSALCFVHSKGLVHRDVKPENLLLDDNNDLKLADFGWCADIGLSREAKRTTICGTPDYLSPEMVLGLEYSNKVDVWSVGVLIVEFITGVNPFHGMTNQDTYDNILLGYTPDGSLSESAESLVSHVCLVLNEEDRGMIGDVYFHDFLHQSKCSEVACRSSSHVINNNEIVVVVNIALTNQLLPLPSSNNHSLGDMKGHQLSPVLSHVVDDNNVVIEPQDNDKDDDEDDDDNLDLDKRELSFVNQLIV